MSQKNRCKWAGSDPLYIHYHDTEWGVALHDDRKLFEFLILEGAQAGLSWLTVLKKRQNYRRAFDGFDPGKVGRYDAEDIERLLTNSGIIRNRLKITSAIKNAGAFLKIQNEFGTFDSYIWNFVGDRAIINDWRRSEQVPAQTQTSVIMSKDLKKKGFSFVGPTICYAFMQAVGMVNDHTVDCFRYKEVLGKQ